MITLLLLSVIPTSISAADPADSTCIVGFQRGNVRGYGSGVLIDGGIVLTCGHGPSLNQRVRATFKNGSYYDGTVIVNSKYWEVGVVQLDKVPSLPTLKIRPDFPSPGTRVRLIGYPYQKGPYTMTGTITQSVAPDTTSELGWFDFTGEAKSGYSGGPVIDDQNRIVGIQHGTSFGNGITGAVKSDTVLRFMWARYPQGYKKTQSFQPSIHPASNRPVVPIQYPGSGST